MSDTIQTYTELSNNAHPIWWKDPGLRRCTGVLGLYMLIQATGGYDKSLINNLQSMPTWVDAVGNPDSSQLGILTAMLSIGVAVASPFFGWLSDWRGRKLTMFVGSAFMLVGAIIQAASKGRGEFMGGRFLIGVGAAGSLCSGPLLVSEISHPRQRAIAGSLYNTFWYVGSIICAWLSFGTAYMTNSDWAWRIPCIGQAVPALVTCIVVYWLPESPRYLVKKGRSSEAIAILARYHANGDEEDPLVKFEMSEIQNVLDIEESFATKGFLTPWLDLLRTAPNRRRMFIITILVCGIDWCGTAIISYYLSKILDQVGISSSTQQTAINGGLQIFNYLTSVAGALYSERLGRRFLWLASFGGMLAVNIPFGICSYLYSEHANLSAGRAVIALVFLYSGLYNIGCNPLPYLYTVEILPYAIRAKGLSYEVGLDALMGVLGQYTSPIGLAALQWKFYFVYTAFLVIWIVLVYFFFPETKGHTLEEISAVFGDIPPEQIVVENVEHVKGSEDKV